MQKNTRLYAISPVQTIVNLHKFRSLKVDCFAGCQWRNQKIGWFSDW